MDIVSALAPPRMCRLAGQTLWVKPYTLEDFAVILAWLDDVTPGKADRKIAPRFNDPACLAAISGPSGKTVAAWAALRHQGYSFNRVSDLVRQASDLEWLSFLSAVHSSRRTRKHDEISDDRDLSEVWFGPNLVSLCERYPGHDLASLGRLTLDQYALLCGEGLPNEDPSVLTWDQVEAMRQEGLKIQAESEAEPEGAS